MVLEAKVTTVMQSRISDHIQRVIGPTTVICRCPIRGLYALFQFKNRDRSLNCQGISQISGNTSEFQNVLLPEMTVSIPC